MNSKVKLCFSRSLCIQQVSSAKLNRSYRRAPKGERQGQNTEPAGICHLCMAGTEGKDWEDWRLVVGFRLFFFYDLFSAPLLQLLVSHGFE